MCGAGRSSARWQPSGTAKHAARLLQTPMGCLGHSLPVHCQCRAGPAGLTLLSAAVKGPASTALYAAHAGARPLSARVLTALAPRQLGRADVDRCRQRRQLAASVRRLEASVASALGISLIHAVPQLMLQPPYRECLQGLAAAGEALSWHLLSGAAVLKVDPCSVWLSGWLFARMLAVRTMHPSLPCSSGGNSMQLAGEGSSAGCRGQEVAVGPETSQALPSRGA